MDYEIAIRTELNELTDIRISSSEIFQAINDAYKEVAIRVLCIENSEIVSTVAGEKFIQSPAGCRVNNIVVNKMAGEETTITIPCQLVRQWDIGGVSWEEGFASFGKYGSTPYAFVEYFGPLPISPGSIISSVTARFNALHTYTGEGCSVNLYFNNVDDAIIPTSNAEAEALALTVATGWSLSSWIEDYLYTSPNLMTSLQQVIDRPGWVFNNNIQLIGRDNGSSVGGYRASWESGSSEDPDLILTVSFLNSNTQDGLIKILPNNVGHIPINDSTPQYWFPWGSYIIIEPVPDAVYPLTIYYSDYPNADIDQRDVVFMDTADITFTNTAGKIHIDF